MNTTQKSPLQEAVEQAATEPDAEAGTADIRAEIEALMQAARKAVA